MGCELYLNYEKKFCLGPFLTSGVTFEKYINSLNFSFLSYTVGRSNT